VEEANDDGCDLGVLSIVAIMRDVLVSTSARTGTTISREVQGQNRVANVRRTTRCNHLSRRKRA